MADHAEKPNLPLMVRFKLFIGSFLIQRCMRSDGTVNRRLLNLFDPKTPAASSVIVGDTSVSSSDVSVDPSRDLWFRLYAPSSTASAAKLPLIVYFHGGGFYSFSPDSKICDDFCRTLAGKLPAVVVSVNYRLAPEHKFPCQYDDGFDALKFINEKGHDILPSNTDLERCFLGGDSAGGNIAHHVAVRAGREGIMKLAGVVAVQPFFGGEERTESEVRLAKAPVLTAEGADVMWRMFLPEGADRNHTAVKVFGGGNDELVKSVEFPRTLVVVGGLDPLQDWQRKYVEWLEKCGKQVELVEYANAFHSFYGFQELHESHEFGLLIQDVRGFIIAN